MVTSLLALEICICFQRGEVKLKLQRHLLPMGLEPRHIDLQHLTVTAQPRQLAVVCTAQCELNLRAQRQPGGITMNRSPCNSLISIHEIQ